MGTTAAVSHIYSFPRRLSSVGKLSNTTFGSSALWVRTSLGPRASRRDLGTGLIGTRRLRALALGASCTAFAAGAEQPGCSVDGQANVYGGTGHSVLNLVGVRQEQRWPVWVRPESSPVTDWAGPVLEIADDRFARGSSEFVVVASEMPRL